MKEKQKDVLGQKLVDNLNRNVLRDNAVFNPFIRSAISFALKTHEGYQKQKRKGKDVPYITHPLIVGMILAKADASDHVIVGGILHDTIEDSIEEKKVTFEMLRKRFGLSVAEIVEDVTEKDKSLSWKERKREALEHIKNMEESSLWVKSADVISNVSEILDDYERDKDVIFARFNASKEDIIANYRAVIHALLERWNEFVNSGNENPLVTDLSSLEIEIARLVK